MMHSIINKPALLIILLSAGQISYSQSHTNTVLQGTILLADNTPYNERMVYLQWPEMKTAVDSTKADNTGSFRFEKFPFGNYSIGVNVAGVDNSFADIFNINTLNPAKTNQHFKIDDGSLVCAESNYKNIKDALENKENIFVLDLNNLQFDVADKSLVIGNDGSKKLSPKIGEFTNLESLSLNINTLNVIPAEIGNLKKLTLLSANLNKLNSLPAEMENLKNLKTLDLGKNNFSQLPEVITKLNALEVLNLEANQLTLIPSSISSLKNLKELNLANCFELSSLPVQIGQLSNLETLDVSGCSKLKSLPDEVINLKNLKVLDVTGTKISTKKIEEAVPGCEVRK